MKALLTGSRIIVGLLFVFSGIVKANDPVGLSFKMQEFFDLWNLSWLNHFSLSFSVAIIAFEIVAGIAVLLGWRMRLFAWLLLVLIIFFTFLTGYAYGSDKFKDCGCFGNCLPISPLTSFLKDLILCALIFYIFAYRKKISPFLGGRGNGLIIAAVGAASVAVQWYALNHLPFVDCLPFRKGNNISEQMQIPPNAVPDSFAIRFVYEKGGKEFDFAPAELPDDLDSYTFVSRKDKLIRKGNAEPPIKGFFLAGVTNTDSTDIILRQPRAILLFDEHFSVPVKRWQDGFAAIVRLAREKNIPVYIVTTQLEEARATLAGTPFQDLPVMKCDFTAIRTAARTNPCLYVLQEGTIEGKWSYRDMDEARSLLQSYPPLPDPEPPADVPEAKGDTITLLSESSKATP